MLWNSKIISLVLSLAASCSGVLVVHVAVDQPQPQARTRLKWLARSTFGRRELQLDVTRAGRKGRRARARLATRHGTRQGSYCNNKHFRKRERLHQAAAAVAICAEASPKAEPWPRGKLSRTTTCSSCCWWEMQLSARAGKRPEKNIRSRGLTRAPFISSITAAPPSFLRINNLELVWHTCTVYAATQEVSSNWSERHRLRRTPATRLMLRPQPLGRPHQQTQLCRQHGTGGGALASWCSISR